MAKTPIIPVQWAPRNGGLNRDTDFQALRNGDLTSALNIRSVGKGEGVSPDYENTVMNTHAYTVSDVVAQNKKWVFYIETGQPAAPIGWLLPVTISDQNGTVITGTTDWILASDNFAVTATELANTLDTILGPGSYTLTTNAVNSHYGTCTLEILTIPYNDYSIYLNIAGMDPIFDIMAVVWQEAIDASLAGIQNCIGEKDLLGDSFQFWTSQKYLPSDLVITAVADNGAGVVRITVPSTASIPDLSLIVVSFLGGIPSSDGKWIGNVINSTQIDLLGSVFGAGYTVPATLTINTQGIGEIGVVEKNDNSNTYSYYRLLRSKEFNFNTLSQIECDAEPSGDKKSLYFTDNYNPPRCFYYRGTYLDDGGLTVVNPLNIYEYGNIASETILILYPSDARLEFISQDTSGGNIPVGNRRYAIRFLTQNFAPTQWSDLSNPINVYSADQGGDPLLLWGNAAGEGSSKVNNFQITNVPVGDFLYVELATVVYNGGAISAGIVKRQVLNTDSIQYISHTGYETQTSLDAGELNRVFSPIKQAKNIGIINNRLVLSNITINQTKDLSDFFQTWVHSIEKVAIPGVGDEQGAPSTYKFNEFYDPLMVNTKVGYMINETYRFMAKVKFKDKYGGFISPAFWIDDIRIDCEAANVTTPNRRDVGGATNTNYDTTTSGVDCDPYIWFVDFHGWSPDTLIDGIPARDLIDTIYIERCECVPEILASGFIVPAVSEYMTTAAGNVNLFYTPDTGAPWANNYGEYPFISGHTFNAYNGFIDDFIPDNPSYPVGAVAPRFTAQRRYGSFYWPGNFYNQESLSFKPGDSLYVYGAPEKGAFYPTNTVFTAGTGAAQNQYTQYNGRTRSATTVKPTLNPILTGLMFETGDAKVDFTPGITYSKTLQISFFGNYAGWAYQKSFVVNTTNDILDINTVGNTDYGFYICQYYREISDYVNYDPDTCKYGAIASSKSIPTGTQYQITSATPTTVVYGTIETFGGDVFTQRTFFKNRYPAVDTGFGATGLTVNLGFGQGVGMYSQNRVNSQMRNKQTPTGTPLYPKYPLVDWLQNEDGWTEEPNGLLNYNSSYTIRNGVNLTAAFDPNIEVQTKMITRIQYSDIKPQNSITDNYRSWPPLNFQDIDPTFGEIVSHQNISGRLLAVQNRKLNLMFMNPAGLLSVVDGSEVIMGDGGRTLAQRPQTLTTYGSRHKWSVRKGKSNRGNDTIYFYDAEKHAVIRWGGDGATPISEVQLMKSFFSNNDTWVYDFDNPTGLMGIAAFWCDRYKEFGLTFRGHKSYNPWDPAAPYTTGSHVSITPGTLTFEQTTDIYVGLQPIPAGTPVSDTNYWQPISHNNPDYYSEFTIVYSETKDKFQAFHTYKPKIYMLIRDSYFSPRPIESENRVYIHNEGVECYFYDDPVQDIPVQIEDGHAEFVINQPDGPKTFEAQRYDSLITPSRVEWATSQQQSFAVDTDFNVDQGSEGFYDSPVFNDSTGTGLNKNDTSKLWGHYMKSRFIFEAGTYQKLTETFTKVWQRARNTFN